MPCKAFIILTQLRQMLTAKRSAEATVQNEQYILFAFKIVQPDCFPFEVIQGKIRCSYIHFNLRHVDFLLRFKNIITYYLVFYN